MVLNNKYVKLSDLMEYPIRLDHYDKKHGNEHFVLGIESVLEYAEYFATSDVAEVKYGQWVQQEERFDGDLSWYRCSNCEKLIAGGQVRFNYCPDCGAKMDGKKLLTWIPRDNWELGCEYECPYCGVGIDVPHGSVLPHKCYKCENEIGVK